MKPRVAYGKRLGLGRVGVGIGADWTDPLDRRWRLALRLLALLPAAVPVLILARMGFRRRWVAEDAFITFRVTRQVLAGNGPVFNIGERVEAYTHPLWMALLTLWSGLGGGIEVGSVVMGLAFAVGGLAAGQAGARRLLCRVEAGRGRSAPVRVMLPLGALVVAVVPATWDYATSGLETGLAFGWLGGSFWLLTWLITPGGDPRGEGARRRPWTAGATVATVVGLGPLIRPDLAVFSAGFFVALLIVHGLTEEPGGRLDRGRVIRVLAAGAALPVGYQVFRMGYFAGLVPNTALAKEAGDAYWSQGWKYLRDFGGTYWLIVPLVPLLDWMAALVGQAGRQRDRPAVAVALAGPVAALIHAFWVIRVGGDFMHGRFLLPSLFGALLPVMLVPVPLGGLFGRSRLAGPGLLAGAVVVGWAVVCGSSMRVPYEAEIGPWGIADERGFYTRAANNPNPITLEDYREKDWVRAGTAVREAVAALEPGEPRPLVLMVDFAADPPLRTVPLSPTVPAGVGGAVRQTNVGLIGYEVGVRIQVLDLLGLADPVGARIRLAGRGRPGHEKHLPENWHVARYADPAGPAPDDVAALRAAMGCGRLATLDRAVSDPLTVGRFLKNVAVAPLLHGFRVSAEPFTAARETCG